jgi:4-amino-4-deoxy-L-arabinose transferase-like glycosyltransferase
MIRTGNYFLPMANGVVDYDKPLLSYWAIIPFGFFGGVHELTLRIPSALAGVGTVLMTFIVGRRLYNTRVGFVAAIILLSSAMYLFWGRIASADLLNMLVVWLILWAFIGGARDGRLPWLFLFYSLGAVGCFVKGPVAPATAAAVILLYSSTEVFLETKQRRYSKSALKSAFFSEFQWIVSKKATPAVCFGCLLFAGLLLLPVIMTGSLESAQLMWKENVVRFFFPFDHDDPPYAYLWHIALFSVPWVFLVPVAIHEGFSWPTGREKRWTLLSTAGIVLFFVLSGSRRSYYILPLLPSLALITGKALTDWLEAKERARETPMRYAFLAVTALVMLCGLGLFYVYRSMEIYHHWSEIPIGLVLFIGGAVSAFLVFKRKSARLAVVLLTIVVIMGYLWGFTTGMKIAERQRTLRSFAQDVKKHVNGSGEYRLVTFQHATASLLFYIDQIQTPDIDTLVQAEDFARNSKNTLFLVDLNEIKTRADQEVLTRMIPVVIQQTDARSREERFALLRMEAPVRLTSLGVGSRSVQMRKILSDGSHTVSK